MSRADLLWGAAAAVSSCTGPSAVAAELRAIGASAAVAYRVSDQGSVLQTPGPDSLQVTVAAAAGDGLINDSPPPNSWEISCIVGGIGIARYGSLAGRAHAEASSRPANTFALAGGQATVSPGFTDGVQVLSDSLDTGAPVTLTFAMTLEAAATHFTDVFNANPDGTGAAARHEVEVRDLDDIVHLPGQGSLVVNSRGAQEGFTTFDLDTAIGHRLEIVADLFVSAGVDIDYASQGFSQGSADVIADNTAAARRRPRRRRGG